MIRDSGTKDIALKAPTTSLLVVSRINENKTKKVELWRQKGG